MAITRTAMVDDDGSGTTGTVINNAWKQQFYDQIDAADAAVVKPPMAPLVKTTELVPLSASVNDWNPGKQAVDWWFVQPSAPGYSITGFLAEAAGRAHLITNTTANAFNLLNQHANSAGPNQILCPGRANLSVGTWQTVWLIYQSTFGMGSFWIVLKAF